MNADELNSAWQKEIDDEESLDKQLYDCTFSEDRGLRTVGPHGGLKQQMPSPNAFDMLDPQFNAICEAIKTWDINVPEFYVGYTGATGSHVMLILIALRSLNIQKSDSDSRLAANKDAAEAAFWNFDARRKGYGGWVGMPQSERDAFKDEFRKIDNRSAGKIIAWRVTYPPKMPVIDQIKAPEFITRQDQKDMMIDFCMRKYGQAPEFDALQSKGESS